MSARYRTCAIVVAVAIVLVALPAMAFAQQDTVETHTLDFDGWDVDFTLPTAARAGCMVCHGDENLIRLREDRVVSYYVDITELEEGPHAAVQCAGCHIDFAFTAPHTLNGDDWRSVAGTACKNCHQEQNFEVGQGAHRIEVNGNTNGQVPLDATDKPICSTCHGAHDIMDLGEGTEGSRQMHLDGYEVCGWCHQDYWDSYNDYYHGRAYKRGALDAPACWDCHGWHDIRPASDRESWVHETRLEATCGQSGCHIDPNVDYVAYAELIHGHGDILEANPLYSLISRVRSAVTGVFGR